MALTEQKRARLEKLSDGNGIISALAFDQRGALKRLMAQHQTEEPTVAQMEELKVLVADELSMDFQQLKFLMKKLVFSLLMKKQVMTQQVQNACQTAWMFGLQNVLKKKVQMQLNSCFTMM